MDIGKKDLRRRLILVYLVLLKSQDDFKEKKVRIINE